MTDLTMSGAQRTADGLPSLLHPLVVRAIDLVWREAELLDERDYCSWLDLYAPDGIYVIPIDRRAQHFDDILNMVYDDQRMRALRVARMTEGYAIAVTDAATTVRTISRFRPSRLDLDTVELRAAQILVAYKRGTHDLWAADVDYTVRLGAVAQDDRLVRKVIRLIDADSAVPAAGFLL